MDVNERTLPVSDKKKKDFKGKMVDKLATKAMDKILGNDKKKKKGKKEEKKEKKEKKEIILGSEHPKEEEVQVEEGVEEEEEMQEGEGEGEE